MAVNAVVLRRLSFRFSARAGHAACLADSGSAGLVVESWSLGPGQVRSRLLPAAATETLHTQPIPAGDRRVVVVRPGRGVHQVAVLEAAAGRVTEIRLPRVHCAGLRG